MTKRKPRNERERWQALQRVLFNLADTICRNPNTPHFFIEQIACSLADLKRHMPKPTKKGKAR